MALLQPHDDRLRSSFRVRWRSETGQPSGGNPTLRLDSRQSAGLCAFERFGPSACSCQTKKFVENPFRIDSGIGNRYPAMIESIR